MPADVISISSAEEDRDPSEADCSSEGSADDESSSEEEASASSETVPDEDEEAAELALIKTAYTKPAKSV